MRVERLVESRPAVLELSLEEASGLMAVGRRLASESLADLSTAESLWPLVSAKSTAGRS